MSSYAALLLLDGAEVQVNAFDGIATLTAVPTTALPAGVLAGTYITFDRGARIAVQGTPADTAAALDIAPAPGVLDVTGTPPIVVTGTTTKNVALVGGGAGDGYTPTLSVVGLNAALVTAQTPNAFVYQQIGDVMHIMGEISLTTSAGIAAACDMLITTPPTFDVVSALSGSALGIGDLATGIHTNPIVANDATHVKFAVRVVGADTYLVRIDVSYKLN